jgi:hypothetical protein
VLDNSVEKTNAGDDEPQLYDSAEVVLDALVSPSARLLWQFLVAAEFAARKLDLAELAGRVAAKWERTSRVRMGLVEFGLGGLDVR